jgi:hypothetical protein
MIGERPGDFEREQGGKVIISPERFKSAGEVKETCDIMVDADRKRQAWRASIDGLVDGFPTYKLSTLKAKGQGWRARVNYRECEGLIQARQTPFYDLVSEVDPCIEVVLDYGKGVDQTDMENAIAKAFHWMLMRRWRSGFNFHVPLEQLEMLKHGIGFHIWPGKKSCWIPRTPTTGSVLFPDGVSLNIKEDLDYFMLRDFLPGYALYAYIANEERATALGWNVDTVWQALAQASKVNKRSTGNNRYDTMQLQREMKAGDIGTTNDYQSGLWLNHLFVKEIETGQISQYTVAEGISVGTQKNKKDDPFRDCLFKQRNLYDDWPIVMMPYDIGSGGILHTVRGLGARTKDFFELSNRLKNAMADQVLVGSLITARQTGNVDTDKLRLMRLGMMNIIPQGLEIATGVQFPPLAQGPIAFDQLLQRTLAGNNESYMAGTPEPVDRETAKSFSARTQNQGQVSKGVHSLYASNYQQLLERMFRTACRKDAVLGSSMSARLAKAFQDRCAKKGVPLDALQHVEEVNEVMSTGAGSAAARLDALLTIFKLLYPGMPEPRKINLERDIVAAYFSSSKVDRYARSHDDNELPDSDASLAVQENNGLAQGGDALVSPTQNHVEHLQLHLQKANEIVQAVMSGQMDPAQALTIIQKFGEHCAKHLQFLQGNPMRKAEFEELKKEWIALSVIADKLQQQVQAAQNSTQQKPAEKVSDQLKIGLAGVQKDERVGMAKVAARSRIDLSKLAIDSRLRAAEVALNGSRKAA